MTAHEADMKSMPIERVSAAARLDRLPITSFHRKMMWLLGFVSFSNSQT